jgi:hypothetical protein
VNCLGLGDSVFVGCRVKAKGAKASFAASAGVLWLGLGLAITVAPRGLIAVDSEDPFQLGLIAYQRGQLNEALKYFREGEIHGLR